MKLEAAFKRLDQFKIGNTQLMYLEPENLSAKVFAKCEWENEFGSIKDRVALAMLKACLKEHPELLMENTPFKIIEYSGGNLAISLAKMCSVLGVKLTVVLPGSVPKVLINDLENSGSEVILSVKEKGFLGAMLLAKKLARRDKYAIFLYQHKNKANIECHRDSTAQEITFKLRQSFNYIKPQAFVASIGTGASLIGIYEGLKHYYPNIMLYATSPEEMPYGTKQAPHARQKFAGSGGLGYGLRQYFVNPYEHEIKSFFNISLGECYKAALNFYHKTGVLIGSSSAANWIASKKIAQEYGPDLAVLTIFPSLATETEKVSIGID
ncbi:MAG: hypothetical protein A3E87_06190 [Gammaproteobacteria bacterium RIFCSPHIGHO2_12_FULL_35_23]|nr:MAG: hypothetical protein A3E87_06190 [Gammaproteobacteria bacterium RIFCSPHIGHO2_12_FULL_35_23]